MPPASGGKKLADHARSRTTSPRRSTRRRSGPPTRAWNRSGVRIRFKQVASRRRALLRHRLRPPAAGRRAGPRSATSRRGHVVAPDRSGGKRVRLPRRSALRAARRATAASSGACAACTAPTSGSTASPRAKLADPLPAQLHGRRGHARARPRARPAPPRRTRARSMSYERERRPARSRPVRWQLRCRPLERDDVQGRDPALRRQAQAARARVLQRLRSPPAAGRRHARASTSTAGSSIRWSLGAGAVRAFISVQREHVRHRAAVQPSTAEYIAACTRPAATA